MINAVDNNNANNNKHPIFSKGAKIPFFTLHLLLPLKAA